MSRLIINAFNRRSTINRNIFGHFSEHLGRCIYEGIYVGEDSDVPNTNGMRNDVVTALKNIKVPVLRWPGGCFADEYHWKDGIGPKENRKKMVNTHWGGVVEDNSFGTHEFMELCAQIGCEPYINGNVGSGTVQELSEWIEYMTFDGLSPMAKKRGENGRKAPWKVKYIGIGNENWGCGGNMRPEYYADEYRRFQTYARDYGDSKLYKIACGSNGMDYRWTEKVMEIAGKYMDAITLHHYTVPGTWDKKGSATAFTDREYFMTMRNALMMDELVSNHLQVMNRYDPQHKVGLIVDEWGTWYDVEPGTNPGFLYQQNTMRDALVAAVTLHIFMKYSGRVVMANIAQAVNVLQAVILTEGAKMVLTPTYHVFDLFKVHHDAALVDSFIETEKVGTDDIAIPNLSVTSSIDANGALHITLANLSLSKAYPIDCAITGIDLGKAHAMILTGKPDSYNDFDNADIVRPIAFEGIRKTGSGISLEIPPSSIVLITVQ